jgi:hypothetical protein
VPELAIEALALVGVDADGRMGQQLVHMTGRRREQQKATIAPQHPVHLCRVPRREGHEDDVDRAAAHGQARPDVRADRGEA